MRTQRNRPFCANGGFADLRKTPAANHQTDFDAPLYNVWKQQEKTPGSGHYGNSEVRWLDNLLYLYTQPFDIVIDPFAGGGSTIEVCEEPCVATGLGTGSPPKNARRKSVATT